MSNLITNLHAFPVERGKALLTWTINGPDWFRIKIVRGSEAGEDVVIGEVNRAEQFLDIAVPTTSLNKELLYKLVADGTGEVFGPVSLGAPNIDRVAAEITRRNGLLLKGWGRPAAFFSVKSLEFRCSCYDTTIGRITVSRCKECFGTGRKGGFADPAIIYVMTTPQQRTSKLTDLNESEKSAYSMWTGGSVHVKPRDVLIMVGNRYRVVDVTVNNLRWTTTRQIMTVVDINPTDVEHDIKLPDNIVTELQTMPQKAASYLG
jgi:hypothetical protein